MGKTEEIGNRLERKTNRVFIISYFFISLWQNVKNRNLYEPYKRSPGGKRHQADLACRATGQEFQCSEFLCLQPSSAEFGGAVRDSKDSTSEPERFDK